MCYFWLVMPMSYSTSTQSSCVKLTLGLWHSHGPSPSSLDHLDNRHLPTMVSLAHTHPDGDTDKCSCHPSLKKLSFEVCREHYGKVQLVKMQKRAACGCPTQGKHLKLHLCLKEHHRKWGRKTVKSKGLESLLCFLDMTGKQIPGYVSPSAQL